MASALRKFDKSNIGSPGDKISASVVASGAFRKLIMLLLFRDARSVPPVHAPLVLRGAGDHRTNLRWLQLLET